MSQVDTSVEAQPAVTPAPAGRSRPASLSVIIPTLNERDNIPEIVARLDSVLAGLDWEVTFVDDDSTDGSVGVLRDLAQRDSRVRFLHRIGRRGLASAVVEGIQSTSAPYVAVMDADLQHDEHLLPDMLARLRAPDCDLVVGSRYIETGGVQDWQRSRQIVSQVATWLAQTLMRAKLSDPMSGFFMVRREAFDRAVRGLSNLGYKILLDVLVSARPPLKVVELPYVFRNRIHGESKLDAAVTWEYLMLLLDKSVGRFVPARFVMFALVGAVGVVVHMLVLWGLNRGLSFSFVTSQTVATVAAMTFNFFVNNTLTYRDKRLKGLWPVLRGLLSFYAVCSIGAASNVGIAAFLFMSEYSWWLSGFAGILVGAVWNYAVSAVFTWRK
jgi:dolichol-phosphate mannosyltransferase